MAEAKRKTKIEVKEGDEVKDIITGYQGICVSITSFLTGCRRIHVQSQKLDRNKVTDSFWFDEPQLKIIKRGKVKIEKDKEIGGYKEAPVMKSIGDR